MKLSTEQLKTTLQDLVTKHNEALQVQSQCKNQIIAIQAVLADREEDEEDGDTETDTSSSSED